MVTVVCDLSFGVQRKAESLFSPSFERLPKRVIRLLAPLVVLMAWVCPAHSWEFSLKGEVELRYRYISRTGPNDLFGNTYDAQRQSPAAVWDYPISSIGLSGPNSRFVQAEGYSSKGADAAYSEMRFWVYPWVRINRAVSARAIVALSGNLNGNFGRLYSPDVQGFTEQPPAFPPTLFSYYMTPSENWGTNPHHSGWIMPESRDIVSGVPIAVPTAYAFWMDIRTPWGTIVCGRRPAGFGVGWVVHELDTYATSLSLIVPWGPLRIVFSQYLHDSGEDNDPNNDANVYQRYWMLNPAIGSWPQTVASALDNNKVMDWNQACALVYRSGNLDMGAMLRVVRWNNVHSMSLPAPSGFGGAYPWFGTRTSLYDDALAPTIGSFLVRRVGTGPAMRASIFLGDFVRDWTQNPTTTPLYGDIFILMAAAYAKYTNGRFFINGEFDIQEIQVRRKGGLPIDGRPKAWAAEGGILAGPLKVSLAHFYRSGHDRRRGLFDPALAFSGASVGYTLYHGWNFFLTRWGGGQGPIAPYNFLIGMYVTGNNSYNSAGNCTYQDFLAYAARLDYALAANLNLFASVMKAERASNTGTPQGIFNGVSYQDRDKAVYPIVQDVSFQWYNTTPNVPDNNLGWEVDVGFDWKLLENLTFKFLFAYWRPGDWFKWAYRDLSRSDPTAGEDLSRRWIINPGRVIDPLIAVQTGMLIEF